MVRPPAHLHLPPELRDGFAVRGLEVLSHDLQLAASACDRLVVLHDGRLVADGIPRDVVTPGLLTEVYRVDADVTAGPGGDPRVSLRIPPTPS